MGKARELFEKELREEQERIRRRQGDYFNSDIQVLEHPSISVDTILNVLKEEGLDVQA